MNLKSIIKKVDNKEVLTCILLIIVGYMTAQLFMRRVNGFNVGGQTECPFKDAKCKIDGKHLYSKSAPDICNTLTKESCNDSWYENTIKGGGNNTTPIGIACYWNSSGNDCVTPGTGFKTITDACPTKSCNAPTPGGKTPAPAPGPGTSYNCNASKCVPVSGKNGSYTNIFDCHDLCQGPISFNCSESKCVPVSGKNGSYTNVSDCISDCEKTAPSYSCSSSGYFSNDDCYNNKKLVDPYKWHLSSASCTDDNCKGCQNVPCSMWYGQLWPYILLILWLVIGIIIGFSLSVGLGIAFFFIVSVIEFLILYYINKSVTPELKN